MLSSSSFIVAENGSREQRKIRLPEAIPSLNFFLPSTIQRVLLKAMSESPVTVTAPAPAPAVKRIVPGAPPPIALSKSQQRRKKKTKTGKSTDGDTGNAEDSPALTEKAPEVTEVQEHVEPAPQPAPEPAIDEPQEPKLSPIVDLITKRLKVAHKKIVSPSPALSLRVFLIKRARRHEYKDMRMLTNPLSTTTRGGL